MKLLFAHIKWMTLELVRQPSYVVATLAFPSIFYVIFAVPESKDVFASNFLLASFSCFAVFGVLFLQFGIGIAQKRSSSWYHYLMMLDTPKMTLITARFVCAYIFALLSLAVLIFLSLIFTDASMDPIQWIKFISVLSIGGLVFCTMGLALGYWTSEASALPVGNVIYLPISFAGGLWKPPELLPDFLSDISLYLPTRQYAEVVWTVVNGDEFSLFAIEVLLFYLFLFTLISYLGMRRDKNVAPNR